MRLTDQLGNVVSLGPQIGRAGGEGAVYSIVGRSDSVAKLYHKPPPPEKLAKLQQLQRLSTPNLQKFAALPSSILFGGRETRGIIMPFVRGREIHQLFSPKERYSEFPLAKWDFLLCVAKNCAAAFDEVHKLGVVVGDVNEGNVLVGDNGLVTLIDCDSYQVSTASGVLTCDVGIELWTPPELQGRNFRGLLRTPNHDLFGLAVLIFKLLFMGRHPFAGVPTQKQELMIEQAIASFMFAFSPKAWTLGIRPPTHCLPLSSLSSNLVALFEAAFLRGSEIMNGRPTAAMWVNALRDMEQNLATCSRDPAHRFYRGVSCPWCSIAVSGGPNFFINVDVTSASGVGPISGLWEAIRRQTPATFTLSDPNNLALPPAVGRPIPAELLSLDANFVWGWIVLAAAVICAIGHHWFFAVVLGITALNLLSVGPYGKRLMEEKTRRQRVFDSTSTDLGAVFKEMMALPSGYRTEFERRKSELQAAFNRLSRIDVERSAELQKLQKNMEEIQRRDFLDKQLLIRANIEGIGPARTQSLLAYGFESALDIRSGMNVPGIGPTFERRLLAWRRGLESRFQFDPSKGVPKQDLHQLDLRMLDLRRNLEGELKRGPAILAQIGAAAATRIQQCENRIKMLLQEQAQARADLAIASQ